MKQTRNKDEANVFKIHVSRVRRVLWVCFRCAWCLVHVCFIV